MLAKPEGDLLLPTYRNKSNCHAGVHSVWYHRVSTLLELNLQVPATMGLVQSILQAVQRAIPVVINPGMLTAIAIPLVPGFLIGMATLPAIATWYQRLKKPSWTPWAPLFGQTWSLLYALMGAASYLVYQAKGWPSTELGLYGVQLVMNLAWQLIFFLGRSPGWAQVDNVALFAAVTATTVAFYRIDPNAGHLMLPYLAFTGFANALNYRIWLDNPAESSSKDFKPPAASPAGPTTAVAGASHGTKQE